MGTIKKILLLLIILAIPLISLDAQDDKKTRLSNGFENGSREIKT